MTDVPRFDGVWAANNPNLQEDFAWRHNHVITVAGKAITTKFYGQPIARSYMTGCSKGGHAVLMEAQRFPEDFDGLLPIAPVYDLTGRIIAGAWNAQAVTDEQQGSVLNNAVAEAVHKSVLARCGAQAGVDEGLVTDPASCDWRPEMVACSSNKTDSGCLTPRQVAAIKKMMGPAVNSKGEVVYGYPDIAGTATEWAGWHYGRGGNPAAPRAYANYTLHEQFLKYMADPTVRSDVDPLKFDLESRSRVAGASEEALRRDLVRSARLQGARRQDADVARPLRCRHPGDVVGGLLRGRGEADGRPRADAGLLPAVSRAGRASLRRRSGPHRLRCAHAAGKLGREGAAARRDDRQPST